jgi:DNA invertase Pin-like site-specific DNA recombinase
LTQAVQEQRCFDYYNRVLAPQGVHWENFHYDAAVSAGRVPFAERPQGRLVFHAAQPGDHVVIARLDRCFRSVLDGASVMTLLEKRGVFLHSLDYNIDTSTPPGRFVRNILLAAAELERDLASDRTRETVAYLKAKELPYTKFPPMGWKFVKRLGKREYRVNPEEREFIETLAAGRAAGASIPDLAIYCWRNRNKMQTTRNFTDWGSVRWALQARVLGYPKVPGKVRIDHMYREHREAGGTKI